MTEELRIRITKCYLVEVVDKNGYVQEYYQDGSCHDVSDYCFGTKQDAMETGRRLIERLKLEG